MLIILDGFGLREEREGNAVAQANTPNLDQMLSECPVSNIETSGRSVGLPDGIMGNSEVGHANIGAGRIVKQDLVRINDDIKNDQLKNNVNRISDMLINSLLQELVKPIDRQITGQKNLIAQINNDLDQTVEDQQSTRDFLASKTGDVKNINTQYQGLINDVESL